MILVLYDRDKRYNSKFIEFLLTEIKKYLLLSFDVTKVRLLEVCINSIPQYIKTSNQFISVKEIINQAASNLIFEQFDNKYIITVDGNVYYNNTYIKLFDLCKFVNYGTLNNRGYSIFTDTFDYFRQHVEDYYNVFKNEVVNDVSVFL